ncbi:dienelactone hydrolase family protein [Mycolicibacterium thermoresistibile]|jgi:carboxymethylenebutenolidase|uniref:Dienelactone hydrolase n=1 Tax=Mycolicibacterium thermoresistibile (strain ATCC 19527 / DSM 44167 / CIP 105390 / JCM 6362 / NCTC 10409 / 316) TaxID=1078020 RepID=G7CD29_MYCT3|nr:dienelactone hydrolase family protein [Mycolicibacterium thermoresistibile]EHI14089.1 dienelactone hydrolase [Mycolicibacterium thermoresistibile ATCC 19527]MCV7186820.1 dienelactone hydrolase family protein [Mycolicibacterium thermoresistibile]SNW17912.1 dienelactone hydrolase-like enzyme [Mycolicibacterium thermoresistibile]
MPVISATVTTADGTCPVTLHTPDGAGPWPGVVLFVDAGGTRDLMREMADRLAGYGYAVLVPDVYYRHGRWEPFDMRTVFGDPSERARLYRMIRSITPDMMETDARAFFDFLQSRPEVKGDRFGVFGYCMGGRMSVTVAGRVPDRVAAAASFHAAGLVTDDPTSPHLLAERIKATVYVAGAQDDDGFTPAHAETLGKALTDAGVEHTIEFYPAGHGFAVPDNLPYDEQAAERHWDALRALFDRELSG